MALRRSCRWLASLAPSRTIAHRHLSGFGPHTSTSSEEVNDRVFSGIQPSGIPHVGNYFGALQQWVKLQDRPNTSVLYCIVGRNGSEGGLRCGSFQGLLLQRHTLLLMPHISPLVADLHALTTQRNAERLREDTIQSAAALLATGIDPEKSTLFVQSRIPQHAELAWMLSCITPMGRLERMTQWKSKGRDKAKQNLGLLSYPVLMAGDILLYK